MFPGPKIAEQIWDAKYRLKQSDGTPVDQTVEDTWRRVAMALVKAEKSNEQATWTQRFYDVLEDFKFLPGGRILAGAGTNRSVTLINCYVMGTIPDSLDGIFTHLREAALTMQQGGGIGYDFSTLRPKGALVKGVEADASGPLSFMDVWDAMCKTLMSAGARRGAMMACMSCQHPDIFDFVKAKQEKGRLTQFNMSVLCTDSFMDAVKENAPWNLTFNGTCYKTIYAIDLWNAITQATYAYAEPGVIFIDRINKTNNLHYCETIAATNPCGEEPMASYNSCDLGSINLAALVQNPFTNKAFLDVNDLGWIVPLAVRMLDNVYDVTKFPLPQQAEEARLKRRLGLGVTGLGNALAMCGIRYGTIKAAEVAQSWVQSIEDRAYQASLDLAIEKGPFPLFDRDGWMASHTFDRLPTRIRGEIAEHGMRNSHLMAVAPTGTISLFAGNVSGGIEPPFALTYTRKVLQKDGSRTEERVEDYAYAMYCRMYPAFRAGVGSLPESFVTAQDLTPDEHLVMLTAVQSRCDTSISKTINLPKEISFDDFKDVYAKAYALGCKSCTTHRPNEVVGSVLSVDEPTEPSKPPTIEIPLEEYAELRSLYAAANKDDQKRTNLSFEEAFGKEPKAFRNADANYPYACPDLDQTELPPGFEPAMFKADVKTLGKVITNQGMTETRLVVSEAVAEGMREAGVSTEDVIVTQQIEVEEEDESDDLLPTRPESLIGKTYKVRWADGVGDNAYYVTINDDPTTREPFEIFVNSKCVEHQAWVTALTRMVSAIFRRGGDLRFVAEELRAVVDPKGGAWIDGRHVPSLPALIGRVLERHMDDRLIAHGGSRVVEGSPKTDLEAMQRNIGLTVPREHVDAVNEPPTAARDTVNEVPTPSREHVDAVNEALKRWEQCPKCGAFAVVRVENCVRCVECLWSRCE